MSGTESRCALCEGPSVDGVKCRRCGHDPTLHNLRHLEVLDTRWILGLDLPPGEKLCLLVLWSFAYWNPSYSDDFRANVSARDIAQVLGVASGTVTLRLGGLRRKGWLRRCDATIGGHVLARAQSRKPPERKTTGHIYLVSFSDGRIKVGMSWDPKTRVQQHAMDARRTGLSAVGSWFSPGIDDPALIEKRVLARIERNGGVRVGLTREYFTGLDFARAVVLAEATCGATP
jgi:hypothetical protein